MNGLIDTVNGFTLYDNRIILLKLKKNISEKPMKGYRYKYLISLCYPGYDINELHQSHRQPQKYWRLQELYEGFDFYNIVEYHYKHIQRKKRK